MMMTSLKSESYPSMSNEGSLSANPMKRFARGKYKVSKPGEQVFKLPAKNNDDDD